MIVIDVKVVLPNENLDVPGLNELRELYADIEKLVKEFGQDAELRFVNLVCSPTPSR